MIFLCFNLAYDIFKWRSMASQKMKSSTALASAYIKLNPAPLNAMLSSQRNYPRAYTVPAVMPSPEADISLVKGVMGGSSMPCTAPLCSLV